MRARWLRRPGAARAGLAAAADRTLPQQRHRHAVAAFVLFARAERGDAGEAGEVVADGGAERAGAVAVEHEDRLLAGAQRAVEELLGEPERGVHPLAAEVERVGRR